jgi:membrane protein
LCAVQHDGARGLSAEALAQQLRTDPLQIEPLLETLHELDWIGLLEEEGEAGGRFVMLCNPQSTLIAPLLGQLLLRPDAYTQGFWTQAGLGNMTLGQALSA